LHIVPSITPLMSHHPLQLLCCPTVHSAAIAHRAAAVHQDLAAVVHCDRRCRLSPAASHCAASTLAAIVRRPLCHSSRHRCLIRDCNRSTVLTPIALPLPIAAAAVHRDLAAAVHRDCCCHLSCIVSQCTASASATIVRRPLCFPLCHLCPVARRDCFAVPSPVAPLLPIAAAVHPNPAAAVHRDCRCH
jgi:hypothetical protein